MDHFERFYRRTLRDVLVGQGVVAQQDADELQASASESNEPFGSVLVEAGQVTSWDLAKVVATHYQIPVLPLSQYTWDTALFEGVSPTTLFQYQVVPVGRFGKTWSFSTVEPPSRECVKALQDQCGESIFFFVSEVTDVQKALQEHVKVVDVTADTSWQSIFDTGDRAVLEDTSVESEEG